MFEPPPSMNCNELQPWCCLWLLRYPVTMDALGKSYAVIIIISFNREGGFEICFQLSQCVGGGYVTVHKWD